MNIHQKSLFQAFLITFILTLFAPLLFPSYYLAYFAPFLIMLYYQKSFFTCLWGSLLCGLIIDLLTSKTPLGFCALSYIVATSILFSQRKNFFSDHLSTLPIMVFFFEVLSNFIQLCLLYIFKRQAGLSWYWIASDLIVMPACNALLAFSVFILPWRLMGKQPRKGKEYFLK